MKDKHTTKKKATRKTLPKDLDELLDAAAASGDYGARSTRRFSGACRMRAEATVRGRC